ncbi:MAG: 2,3-bisphosphoglycerate-independent phosphoglycerate mutase [Deltaproteobacteria bacterium CG_4_10_14_0_2_um_filter_43_8]|nr:MAG: phosphoglycerate mutase (2,3-diphosphoglycerate-independent) [Deltaproteobacteria bacterium CG11_big_fil_rev_8_21_14_0_20_42_23]PJA18897.1 MAG: 2,3-bisphosphoglycerate-independent phosphoglycerate mutase [Deltaproteobacteria bacterium CG_4_10_14_0_2_um_filter_43_8]PJC63524.1 MAG: 2,3-bisphosphoglycerate-independent phosphoglycerate mutase [Deltaproteobacteria bacterium CG_4_9_14_0_2_um_filter_42_21]
MKQAPVMLMILDGWGWREDSKGNAVLAAKTPCFDRLWKTYPHCFLRTCGEDVGLPDQTMGNSEVGHLNIGAGRIVYQDLTRINKSIASGEFFHNPHFLKACQEVVSKKSKLHLMGLCSDAGVHSSLAHLFALLDLAKAQGVKEVLIHAITDGRDSRPTSGEKYLSALETKCAKLGNARIATVSGRYYAMDRDRRWERTEKAWKAIVMGEGEYAENAMQVLERAYQAELTDEFILPSVVDGGQSGQFVKDGDAFIFFNFRSDRARQISRAVAMPDFTGFARPIFPKLSTFVCMTEYDATLPFPIAFPQKELRNILGEVVSNAGLTQFRIAETEKYAHVTFFFNGGIEIPFAGEDRVLVPSPKEVATYDEKPEMSAAEVTSEVIKRIEDEEHDLFIMNFANADMVGHTGVFSAAVKAVETVDASMEKILNVLLQHNGSAIIIADHGNAEQMLQDDGSPHTSHTLNKVPCLFVSADAGKKQLKEEGILADVAPSLLELLHLEQPAEMTGTSLFQKR